MMNKPKKIASIILIGIIISLLIVGAYRHPHLLYPPQTKESVTPPIQEAYYSFDIKSPKLMAKSVAKLNLDMKGVAYGVDVDNIYLTSGGKYCVVELYKQYSNSSEKWVVTVTPKHGQVN